jgi:hypothetical protein
LNKERIEPFLYNLPGYRESLRAYPHRGNAALLAKLSSLVSEYTSSRTRLPGRRQK